jgi:adenine-specific DNA-methyltransferase
VELTFSVHRSDFVLENAAALAPGLFDEPSASTYDVAISNPPYFKLRKTDPRAVAASAVVHGQPNIYALFMAIMANLLRPNGVMLTITPRSFATGDYFREFRRHLFGTVTPEVVHVFHSRAEAFRDDDVLQENVIMRSRRAQAAGSAAVETSASVGLEDLGRSKPRRVPLKSVVEVESRNMVFHVPLDEADDEVLRFVRQWPMDFERLGLGISTGPVVAFRAAEFLVEQPEDGLEVAPLLWLQHVKPMRVDWPLPGFRKPQFIRVHETPRPLLIPNASYVLLRRFTAKEERRRLVAAPLLRGQLSGQLVGFENHLNYVYRRDGTLSDEEAVGLAALLGSPLMDRYFRVSSGSTQVNASEVRTLPLPSRPILAALGGDILRQEPEADGIQEVVGQMLRVPARLRGVMDLGGI